MTVKNLFAAITVGFISIALANGSAFAQASTSQPAKAEPTGKDKDGVKVEEKKQAKEEKKQAKQDSKAASAAKIGEVAPDFKLTDTEGKEVSLAALTKAGKTVVIEWYNPECPFIVKHHKTHTTFNDLHAKYAAKGVEFVAINSGAKGKQGYGKELNTKMKADYKLPFPVLLDETGDVGRAYGAKTTPHVFIVTKDGKLAYNGAIDDDRSADTLGKTNYVAKALDEILANTSVSTPETKPYGCSVKY